MKIGKIGRLLYKVGFDLEGFWINDSKGQKNMLWFWIGPSYEEDLAVYNLIIGPFGIAFAWDKF